jgi:hypothetical protein
MKYVVLIYNAPGAYEALSDDDREALGKGADRFFKEFTDSGEFIGGAALADASQARTLRGAGGTPAVTDGPFAEAKEQLAGYYILDCESIERAVEIASHDPASRLWAVEVRPVMDTEGAEF